MVWEDTEKDDRYSLNYGDLRVEEIILAFHLGVGEGEGGRFYMCPVPLHSRADCRELITPLDAERKALRSTVISVWILKQLISSIQKDKEDRWIGR